MNSNTNLKCVNLGIQFKNGWSAILIILSCFFISFFGFSQTELYVDATNGKDVNNGTSINTAFKTIEKAKDVIRNINNAMTENITVFLRGGNFNLSTPLVFTSLDSGTNGFNIIYKAYNCEIPVVSGGVKVSNWIIHDRAKNIYKTSITSNFAARQLYVNGSRAIRARSVNAQGWIESGNGYNCPPSVADWNNIKYVEVVSFKEWKCHRGSIASISGSHVTMTQPYWDNLHTQYDAPPVWIENAYELLDEENEWYLDYNTNMLYYKPTNGVDISSLEFILPKLEILIQGDNLNNVQFEGITFAYATWLDPSTANGFACLQAEARIVNNNEETQMSANITFSHAQNVQFNSCNFEHFGYTALQFFDGCKNNRVYNNSFTDISGSAISIGNIFKKNPSEDDTVRGNIIENNFIQNVANEFYGCVGIFAAYTDNLLIKRNEIRNLPYSAISVGWGWSNSPTVAENNVISFNLIDSVVTELTDGGAIYTLSNQLGSKVHDNYIKNQINQKGALYPDEGSSNMEWYNNVIENAPLWLHIWTPSIQYITVENNFFNNNKSVENGTNCIISNNTYVPNNIWPTEASKIINNAGRIKLSCNKFDNSELDLINIILYPNPVVDNLIVSFKSQIPSNFILNVYSVIGSLIFNEQKENSGTIAQIDFSKFPPGLYFVQIKSASFERTYKILKTDFNYFSDN